MMGTDLEEFAEVLRSIDLIAARRRDFGESDADVTTAIELARLAFRFCSQRHPTPQDRDRMKRVATALKMSPLRGDRSARPWYTIPEVAELLGLSRWATKRWLERHGVPHEKDGRNRRIWLHDLERTKAWPSLETKRQWRPSSGVVPEGRSAQIYRRSTG